MTAERWQQIQSILDAAADVPAAERGTFLERSCGDDRELRREVEELLELDGEVDEFLAAPAVPGLRQDPEVRGLGRRIGPYRLVELLGRGGMGTVYRAVREDDFEKQVALKLVQRGGESETALRRFDAERQILANLEHPAIAQLLDGGTDDEGRPYLVMEHVDGVPIDRYAEEQSLGVDARIELFLAVCGAVALAHRNLVVHRDLKPDNILVTAEGTPKLLDFGIAKLLAPDPADRSRLTRADERPMTPRYASPEQVRGEPITTASDVYSLGLLLFGLLAGRLPCGLDEASAIDLPRRICEVEAERPSAAAERRLSSDLDAIVLKALRKEPGERYASVAELATDLRRYLRGRPVRARRGTALYLAGKFVRRNVRPLLAAAALLLLATGFSIYELRRLDAERLRAEKTAEFLKGLVNAADPDVLGGALVTPGAILDQHREQLTDLREEPELYVELAGTLGQIYHKLGRFDEAGQLLGDALDVYRELHPGDDPETAWRINNLAMIHLEQGDWPAAEGLFRDALAMRRRLGQGETAEIVTNLNNLATVLLYRGAYEEAEALYRRGLEIRVDAHGRDSLYVSYSLRSLGALHHAAGDFEKAEPLLLEALEIRRREYGPEDRRVASVLRLLGDVAAGAGETWRAEEYYHQALGIQRRRLGHEHVEVAVSERQLAALLLAEGELATVRVILPRVDRVLRQTRGGDDWSVAVSESLLGALYLAEGDLEMAEPCLVESFERLRASRGKASTFTREARRRLEALERVSHQLAGSTSTRRAYSPSR